MFGFFKVIVEEGVGVLFIGFGSTAVGYFI